MPDQTLLTDRAGQIILAFGFGGGLVQQFGNFPRFDQNFDEPGNDFESSAKYSSDGRFQFNTTVVSVGQQVLFDVAINSAGRYYATNLRVQ